MSDGWIKLYRKSMNSVVFQNSNRWKVWCWCLLKANHKSTKFPWNGGEIEVQAGQFITGREKGAAECNMPESTFWKVLKGLKKIKNVDIDSNTKNSLVTIINWEKYQCEDKKEQQKEQQGNNEGTHTRRKKNDKKIF